jgi:2'-5' RNA ligase
MSNVVLGYPIISPADFEWIQNIRRTNDRLYEAVNPHFTFVFPTTKLSEDDLIRHTRQKSKGISKIKVTLSKAVVVEDDSKTFFHTFLVPSDGDIDIVALHDLLYTDSLSSELREDIPFVPHVGIATNESESVMQDLADKINADSINISGSIDTLTVASYDGKRVHDIMEMQLQ